MLIDVYPQLTKIYTLHKSIVDSDWIFFRDIILDALGKQPKLFPIAVAVRHFFPFLCGVLYHIVTIAWHFILLCNDHSAPGQLRHSLSQGEGKEHHNSCMFEMSGKESLSLGSRSRLQRQFNSLS